MKAVHLQCEYMTEPMGIDCRDGGVRQSAYEIRACSDAGALLWESGRISSSSMRTVWGGPAVPAETRVIWSIRLYDENGRPGEETTASFETGLPAGQACEEALSGGLLPEDLPCAGGGNREGPPLYHGLRSL